MGRIADGPKRLGRSGACCSADGGCLGRECRSLGFIRRFRSQAAGTCACQEGGEGSFCQYLAIRALKTRYGLGITCMSIYRVLSLYESVL